MASIVSIDCATGTLRRFEIGGSAKRHTHTAIPTNGPGDLNPRIIESFRVNPPDEFKLDPPPSPPSPPLLQGGGEGKSAAPLPWQK